MSDYPMLISNKLHSFRNFYLTKIKNIFQPGGVTYGKLLRQISKQYE